MKGRAEINMLDLTHTQTHTEGGDGQTDMPACTYFLIHSRAGYLTHTDHKKGVREQELRNPDTATYHLCSTNRVTPELWAPHLSSEGN